MSDNNKAKLVTWPQVLSVLKAIQRAVLYGPPGTGKSRAAFKSLAKEEPWFSLTMTEDTPAAELRGHFVPSGPGEFAWLDGPCLRWWDQGGLLVLNEIDKASADALSFLFAVLDPPDQAAVTLPTGDMQKPNLEVKFPHRVIATMNGIPEDLPEALRSRLGAQLFIAAPAPEAFKTLPKKYQQVAENMFKGCSARDFEHVVRQVGFRGWENFVTLVENLPGALKDKEQLACKVVWGPDGAAVFDALRLASEE